MATSSIVASTTIWSKVSGPGVISFSPSNDILNPSISANVAGDYVAMLTVTTEAGNVATSTIAFTWHISTPPSSGGGGGGGSVAVPCSQIVYSEWGECFAGKQYRNIVSTTPGSCSPTEAQRVAQTRDCVFDCESVVYGNWGECSNGFRYRDVTSRYPESCKLTTIQEASTKEACGGGGSKGEPFDSDALDVMELARKAFTKEDKEMVNRLLGQILIQVEDKGRAWYVNPNDGRKYYLGSPLNAFSVMSLIGKGISNNNLKKLPVGILDGSLSLDKDSDGDGLTDRLEEALGTDLFKKDTDGDGYSDYEEVINNYDPLSKDKMVTDKKLLKNSLGQIYIQVETNGEAWYVEPRSQKKYYLGRPIEAFEIMRQFGLGITNEDLNKIPVGQFNEAQLKIIEQVLKKATEKK